MNPPVLRPQRLLREAARDKARMQVPIGIGLDSPGVRLRMVARLRQAGVASEAVLAVFEKVPRHQFLDSALVPQAYEDTSLPIGHGQTISKPSVVARMLELLWQSAQAAGRARLGRVLEIGTGCGYQAALLALMSDRLSSVERIGPLHAAAAQRLNALQRQLPLCALDLQHADGQELRPRGAPFDAIVSAAGGEAIPESWLQQLAPGGRLIAPLQLAQGHGQRLVVVDRALIAGGSEWRFTEYEAVSFVPLKSGLLP